MSEKHEARVATHAGPFNRTVTVAWCRCGWREAFETSRLAKAAADEHAKGQNA